MALTVVPGLEHALADEPGVEPAPQTPAAAVVDRHATAWLRQHLSAGPVPAVEAGTRRRGRCWIG